MKIWCYINLITRFLWKVRTKLYNIRPDINIGKDTIIEPNVVLSTRAGGSITIGNNCWISQGAQIITWGGDIIIGDNSTINPCSIIYGQGGTTIGNGVRIAAQCVIVPSNHNFNDKSKYIYEQGLSKKGIVIEDNVWLGAGVKVLDGVKISFGTVVGANAVVTRSTERDCVYVGIPARKIKDR